MEKNLWSTVIWDAQSGDRLEEVEASGGTWQRGAVTEQSHVFPLRNLGLSRAVAHDLFGKDRPRDRVLAQCWDGTPVYHGLLIDSDYAPETGALTVKHIDVRELAAARWLYGIGGSSQTFDWGGLSWRGMARRIARIIFTDPISPAWPLPVTLPAEEAGNESFPIYGYEFRSGESLLTDVEEMPNGPDLDFHPRKTGNQFGWDLRIGSPYLSGPSFEYHLQAEEQQLTDVNVKTVGQEKVTGVHGIGDGSEWDMVRGGAAAPVSAGLARDTKLTVKTANRTTVDKRSAGYLASRLNTYQQWSFSVQDIDVAALRLGSILQVHSRGDEWVNDGITQHRVLGFAGDLSTPSTISLTLETI
ncbi:hypothetical protein ACYX8G_19695 [Microbacterium saperdae]